MPITPYLNGVLFDPETKRVLGVAFEMVCIALRTGDCDDGVKHVDPIVNASAGGSSPS
jgi:hypothetical protein